MKEALDPPVELAADFFQEDGRRHEGARPCQGLGYFPAGYLLFVRQPDQKAIVTALTGKTRPPRPASKALLERECDLGQPLKVFKTLLYHPVI